MSRIFRVLTARHTAVLGVLAIACSDGSGPGNGSTTGSIAGTVTSAGVGVPSASLALTGAGSGTATSAASGAYLFDDLAAGAYTVTLTVPGGFALGPGETAARNVTLTAGQDATVNYVLTAANPDLGIISGTVTAGGQGVQGAAIALAGAGTGNTTTSASGAYSFPDLDPGNYTLTVTLPAGFTLEAGETAAKPATVTAGQTATVNWTAEGPPSDVTIVTLSGTSFTPSTVTIPVGGTVRWVVNGGTHTVTPDTPGQPGAWTGTGLLTGGDQFEHTFGTAGDFDYHCIPHESLGMTGTITVQ